MVATTRTFGFAHVFRKSPAFSARIGVLHRLSRLRISEALLIKVCLSQGYLRSRVAVLEEPLYAKLAFLVVPEYSCASLKNMCAFKARPFQALPFHYCTREKISF